MKKAILWTVTLAMIAGGGWTAYRYLWQARAAAGGGEQPGKRKILYYQDPMNPAHRSDKAGKSSDGMDFIPVYAEEKSAERKLLYYQDPMHPAYKSNKPGQAPDCGMDLVPIYADEGKPVDRALPAGTIRINPEKQQLIGVQYGQVETRRLARTIRAVGRLTYDETRIARIHGKIEGYIEQVMVDFTGKEVRKGEPLLTIYSPELLATQQEFLLAARARRQLADSPFREVSSGSESLYQAARKRLDLWDISEEQIADIEKRNQPRKNLTLYAPLSGFVTARNAFPRQRVTPETELYAISDLSVVWVLADLYEYEIPLINVGQQATMTLSYFPGQKFSGKVTYLYPQLDPMTRTLKVRLEFPNPEYRLRPDMFANVEFAADFGQQLAVPQEAVLDSGAERTVFVDRGDGYLEPRKVELREKVDGWYIVHKGLAAGERVVTSGNFLVDSESLLKSAAGAMGGHAGMPGMSGGEKKQEGAPGPKTGGQAGEAAPQRQPGGEQMKMDMPAAAPKKERP